MFGPNPWKNILLVANFELRELLRSRRAFLIAGLYLIVTAFTTFVFVEILTQANTIIPSHTEGLGQTDPSHAPSIAPPSQHSGPSQKVLFGARSPFRGILSDLLGDNATLEFLVSKPPIALFYTLVSFMFVPFLLMMTASDSLARDHQSRGIRFVTLRTGRAELALGKMLGLILLIAL